MGLHFEKDPPKLSTFYCQNDPLKWVWVSRLKGAWSYFQNLVFSSFEEPSLQRCKFQISVEMVKLFGFTEQFCILQLPIPYCVLA